MKKIVLSILMPVLAVVTLQTTTVNADPKTTTQTKVVTKPVTTKAYAYSPSRYSRRYYRYPRYESYYYPSYSSYYDDDWYDGSYSYYRPYYRGYWGGYPYYGRYWGGYPYSYYGRPGIGFSIGSGGVGFGFGF